MREAPLVIAVAGGSASGKTTLTKRLVQMLSAHTVCVVHMDHYFVDSLPKATSPHSGRVYDDYNHPTSFDLPRFHQAIDSVDADIVIAEGLLTLWDDVVCERADMRVFVDCPADVRVVRRIRRNMGYGMEFDDIAAVYLDLVRDRHEEFVEPSKTRADIVIDGMADIDMSAAYLAECITVLACHDDGR